MNIIDTNQVKNELIEIHKDFPGRALCPVWGTWVQGDMNPDDEADCIVLASGKYKNVTYITAMMTRFEAYIKNLKIDWHIDLEIPNKGMCIPNEYFNDQEEANG